MGSKIAGAKTKHEREKRTKRKGSLKNHGRAVREGVNETMG